MNFLGETPYSVLASPPQVAPCGPWTVGHLHVYTEVGHRSQDLHPRKWLVSLKIQKYKNRNTVSSICVWIAYTEVATDHKRRWLLISFKYKVLFKKIHALEICNKMLAWKLWNLNTIVWFENIPRFCILLPTANIIKGVVRQIKKVGKNIKFWIHCAFVSTLLKPGSSFHRSST